MKKVITHSICMLVMITSIATGFASNISSLKAEEKSMEITLTLDNVKEGQQLFIKDIDGTILYKKVLDKKGIFSNTYDFTALPAGSYYFEHEKDFQIKLIPFKVTYNKVTFDKANEKTIFKPVLNVKDSCLYFSKLDLEKGTVKINIFHDNEIENTGYHLVHSENFKNALKIERIYSLTSTNKGNYKVVISANGRDFVEYFSI
ncbi:hypothetical protein FNB79_03465 [Formosa sediminum]|uniref:T9SS type A sorting domain-containing protein n=1 Tax=Formosa sediminum TaxID=2594004 RepID=A0A516GNG3_9FLAO|nr:hypothetical protein [Formosa sediminum]QDO93071.1 hypothetical protein FNB79_03465 [Formosa sediminum]